MGDGNTAVLRTAAGPRLISGEVALRTNTG